VPHLLVRTRPGSSQPGLFRLSVGNLDVLLDFEVRGTEAAPGAEVGSMVAAISDDVETPSGTAEPVYVGNAWIGGAFRPVRCDRIGECLRLTCEGSRAFVVGPGGAWISAEPRLDRAPDNSEVEIAVGPVLLLALALRGTFALHAAAVATLHGVVALVGESGAGKSTLAAPAGPGWDRLADDILPFGLVDGSPTVFPHYPQLKLPDAAQYPRTAAPAVPLAAVCEIGPPAEDGRGIVERLSPRDGALCLVSHTVAARLFPEELLEAHLDACAAVAARVAVVRLHYPRTLAGLPAVRQAVIEHLAGVER
jgi:hypothetical protein